VFKDLAHVGISNKHGARFSPASPLGQGTPLYTSRQRPLLVLCAELSLDGPTGEWE